MSVGVVVNPVAGGGRMRREWPAIAHALTERFGAITIEETQAAGDACTLARKLSLIGATIVIAAGGDGTISEVVDGLLQARVESGSVPELGIVPIGTGSDLARCLGIGTAASGIAAQIADAKPRLIDAGRVDFIDDHGALASRHFVNITSLGLSGPAARAINSARRGAGAGKGVFLWHTVKEILRYRFQAVRVTIDDAVAFEGSIALVAIANGRYFGAGMMIAPDALQDDGLAEIVIVKGTSKFALLRDLRLVYSGAHRNLGSCVFLRGKKVLVEPVGDPALIDIDGESPGRIPATIEIMRQVLPVRC
jgi:diacylglycerol kinase (ATP)